MGKIVKYCAACEEGFAEKFGFCPNCGENLQAFEMNPVQPETIEPATNNIETASAAPETLPLIQEPIPAETAAFSGDDVLELDSVDVAETSAEERAKCERRIVCLLPAFFRKPCAGEADEPAAAVQRISTACAFMAQSASAYFTPQAAPR